ncbi:MAG: methylenetetrahydrofolate--tRNA-(uracil(54)-C(5))-methyltransferase (FADH(2)-oxidizing) TrmFO [Chitinivibrionia bacterium]|nr:methylenetetrahydrofolate--tRNA-(uracil(54)-C(5))-methyltransferase (FADH(2)-oxidizing) TrmFO [Chitinivibrionia bacterium]
MSTVTIVGGGLAGSEASWQLAGRGIGVTLIEMRPAAATGAHRSGNLAEIVCSNSLKSIRLDTAAGLLKAELAILGSKLLSVAAENSVPAGHALAVDRELFSSAVTALVEGHRLIEVRRTRQDTLDLALPAIIATGPLTDPALMEELGRHFSSKSLYFYDAIAPSIDARTIDESRCFRGSRYGKGEPDYLNVPLDEDEYSVLLDRIRGADILPLHQFEEERYFEACLPIEVMAARGDDTLRFGPLRPKGLADPRTGAEPYAVLQLRQEKRDGSLYGLVGFQTRMRHASQVDMVRCLPGLERAEILRFGAIHRNSFIDTPRACVRWQMDRKQPGLFYAGQLCGVEGYVECIASGLVAALSVFARLCGRELPSMPGETLVGALMNYIHTERPDFQPMNANMGILPPARTRVRDRGKRNLMLADRALEAMRAYRNMHEWLFTPAAP